MTTDKEPMSPSSTLLDSPSTTPPVDNDSNDKHSSDHQIEIEGEKATRLQQQGVTKHSARHGTFEELINVVIDSEEEERLLWKLDLNIGPIVMILYLLAFLDRSNLSNAYVGGMGKDLDFPTNGLSVCASILYATYVIFEVPATMLLRSFRPSRLIPLVAILWGALVLGTGFAQNYATIVASRLVLGVFESALSPCLFLYMTTFYQRNELALRSSYLYVCAALAGLVGGLIAAGFLKMDGVHGIAGWRWIYIIEGAITVGCGIIVHFFMPDTYEHSRCLTEKEKRLMAVREAKSALYNEDHGFSWSEIKKCFTDPMCYIAAFSQLCIDVCLYGYATFLVVIIKELGYSAITSQALTAPGYGLAAVVYVIAARLADKKNSRFLVMLPLLIASAVGFIVLLTAPNTGGRMAGAFIAGMGIYVGVGFGITWLNLNVAGYRKRSAASGWQQAVGNCGGIVAGQIYRSSDATTHYKLGNGVSLGCMIVATITFGIEYMIWKKRNDSRDKLTSEEKDELDQRGVGGDHHYDFRYAL